MAVDHVFAVHTGHDAVPLYPLLVTVETAVADGIGLPVLAALEQTGRRMLDEVFAARMEVGPTLPDGFAVRAGLY